MVLTRGIFSIDNNTFNGGRRKHVIESVIAGERTVEERKAKYHGRHENQKGVLA
jgi:hypothetical protein